MARNWQKFRLLVWKNSLLQWRHKCDSAKEILIPVVIILLIFIIRMYVDATEHKEPTTYQEQSISDVPTRQSASLMAWSPTNAVIEEVLKGSLGNSLGKSFASSKHLLKELTDPSKSTMNESIAAVQFPDNYKGITALPKKVTFSLRFPTELRSARPSPHMNWQTSAMFPPVSGSGPRLRSRGDGGTPPGYIPEGFAAMQNKISMGLINQMSNTTEIAITMHRFPHPPYVDDPLPVLLDELPILAAAFLIGFLFTCTITVKKISTEKEKQLKESMKIMGLSNWLHWTAWFVQVFIFGLVTIIIITIILKIRHANGLAILTHAAASVVFVFLVMYLCATITLCFMISVFFSKGSTAAFAAQFIWIAWFLPFYYTYRSYNRTWLFTKLAACLLSNSAMGYGFKIILMYEKIGAGVRWSNLFTPVTPDDNFNMGLVILLLIFDAILYLVIALYVEGIFPGEYGVPQPWNFPFTRAYCCGEKVVKEEVETAQSENTEPDPEGLYPGIQIYGLRKVYANKKVAVVGLTMNMYEDQITVLLGHNGAGKTTTMSILCGVFPPTSGTATVNGFDIRTNMDNTRDSLGFCPQHNVLFDDLTVRENLSFFTTLKGLDEQESKEEIEKYLDLLELSTKADSRSSELSGGMQRKLSAAVALCGGSRVVLFDEPTSGMDPAARRALWDLLQNDKKGRTILLSTHYMDEADILGDRIAIMAGGQLKCLGSSFYLKKTFGEGYHLIIVKDKDCDVSEVTALLAKYIPNIKIESDVGTELSYLLSDEFSVVFEQMLVDLEKNSDELHLVSYGVSSSLLAEVFMKVGLESASDPSQESRESTEVLIEEQSFVSGSDLTSYHYSALLTKKYIYCKRAWVLLLIQILLPAVLCLIVLCTSELSPDDGLTPLRISLDPYATSVSVLSYDQNTPGNARSNEMFQSYKDIFNSAPSDQELLDIGNRDMQEFILEQSKTNLPKVKMHYLVGATFKTVGGLNAKGWFNNEAYHTVPIALNLVHNAVLRSKCKDCRVEVINEPLPNDPKKKLQRLVIGDVLGILLVETICYGMAIFTALYIFFYIKERVSKAKLLQYVSGVRASTFWISAFICDIAIFYIAIVLIIIVVAPFQVTGFATFEELGRCFLVLMFFGWPVLPYIYIMSFWFNDTGTGFTTLLFIFLFTGAILPVMIIALYLPIIHLDHVAWPMEIILMGISPHYTLFKALYNLNMIGTKKQACSQLCSVNGICDPDVQCSLIKDCCVKGDAYFGWTFSGIGVLLLIFVVTGIIYFLILLLCFDVQLCGNKCRRRKIPPQIDEESLDSDVKEERDKVHNMNCDETPEYHLVLRDVTKYYGKFLAVNQLTICVSHTECFGLMGVNGAGKTSTFKMLTGDVRISSGKVFVRGMKMKSERKKIYRIIGYCPQFDALIDVMTCRETLHMYCLLRGVPRDDVATFADKLAHEFNFYEHIDKKVKECSGGTKRKLSTAIALIGNPSVIYLDEPTAGMDPGAKRQVWKVICRVRDEHKCVILTSHSMEECEALCTRLTVMVNGELKCLGSSQYLKNKFSEGFKLTIKVKPKLRPSRRTSRKRKSSAVLNSDDVDEVKNFVLEKFPGAELKQSYQNLQAYSIPATDGIPLSRIFGIMEAGKEELGIEDYSLGQTSLEEVFLSFTETQRSNSTRH